MADPQPKVLKRASTIWPVDSSTLIWSFMTSPQAGAPTRPVPTSGSFLSKEPTLRGLLKWSMTRSWYWRGSTWSAGDRACRDASPWRILFEVSLNIFLFSFLSRDFRKFGENRIRAKFGYLLGFWTLAMAVLIWEIVEGWWADTWPIEIPLHSQFASRK